VKKVVALALDDSAARRAAGKLEDGDVKGAIRALSSMETFQDPCESAYRVLLTKHPMAEQNRRPISQSQDITPIQVSSQDVTDAMRTFPSGSAGGPDGLRPQHLKDMLSGPAGQEVIGPLTELVNLLLAGEVPDAVLPVLYGASLLAFNKKGGGLRPIAVGYMLRRLAAKVSAQRVMVRCAGILSPHQLGVGVVCGAEAAVHAARRFLQNAGPDNIFIKIDMCNAFNSLHRDALFDSTLKYVPELFKFVEAAYAQDSILTFGSFKIQSAEGLQQGDPLVPLLFCLAVHDVLSLCDTDLKIGYLDDLSLGGETNKTLDELDKLEAALATLGLFVNNSKCELIALGEAAETIGRARRPDFIKLVASEVSLLVAPLFDGILLGETLRGFTENLVTITSRLQLMPAHDSFFLLKNCLSIPKLLYTLRTSPCSNRHELKNYDEELRATTSRVLNINLNDDRWEQAGLPVRWGGVGIRSGNMLAPSAYLASAACTSDLANCLLLKSNLQQPIDPYISMALACWKNLGGKEQPTGLRASSQRAWDNEICQFSFGRLLDNATDSATVARLKAAHTAGSGDWLNALPLSAVGLKLDDKSVSVSVGLRLGAPIVAAHRCRCGAAVGVDGRHGLSCRRSGGRLMRHNQLNDLVQKALQAAKIPAKKEPSGISRSDGKRPDGISLIPWRRGKCLAWDVTCPDTFASSHVKRSAAAVASAADQAESNKRIKYRALEDMFHFVPIAIETTGVMGAEARSFLADLGRRLAVETGEPRSHIFLRQRLSMAVQRGNAASIFGTIDDDIEPDDGPFSLSASVCL